ncbi:MAG: glutamate racemase [Campylobacterales bacterium]|nr:glutamate racemase [Campylobacterales bacterium]
MNIGVFDSGLGGLTVVGAMLKHLKGANIYYVADTANAPYGEKTKDQIIDFSIAITKYLIKNYNIDALVVACNTATSAAIAELREKYPNLIIVGTEPGLKPAISHSKTKKVGILATPATLSGEKYKSLVDELSNQYSVEVFEQACDGLVQQIEKGETDTPKTISMLDNWLAPMRDANVDTIVLGCTHYPLVSKAIKQVMVHPVELIQTADAISKRVLSLLEERGHINSGETQLYIASTGDIKPSMIEYILGKKIEIDRIVIQ